MKNLKVSDIISVVEGKIVSGSQNQIINNVANYKDHVITDHTLVFIMDGNKLSPLPPNIKSITVVTSNPKQIPNTPITSTVIQVPNVRRSFFRFIHFYRRLFKIPVIGVTGTCGKTTTKEMISWILSEKQNVVSTYLSHNGLKRNLDYLIKMDDTTESAVFEMGISGPNQLLYSARYFQPNIGIITTIGTDHIEGFKSQSAYVKEKAKMITAVQNGTLILNVDDANIRKLDLSQFKGTVIYYGTTELANVQAHSIAFNLDKGGMDFQFVSRKGTFPCFVPGFGTHNVYNALAAIIASTLAGVELTTAIKRLETFQHVKSHLQFQHGIRGSIVIDDSWNTNPTSIESALEVLKKTADGRKKIAIIGEIEELGSYSVPEHEKVGELAVKYDVDILITIGKKALPACRKAAQLGMNTGSIHNVTSESALFELIDRLVHDNTIVLLKTSMRKSFKTTLEKLIAH